MNVARQTVKEFQEQTVGNQVQRRKFMWGNSNTVASKQVKLLDAGNNRDV